MTPTFNSGGSLKSNYQCQYLLNECKKFTNFFGFHTPFEELANINPGVLSEKSIQEL
jgi:hypothetical protein